MTFPATHQGYPLIVEELQNPPEVHELEHNKDLSVPIIRSFATVTLHANGRRERGPDVHYRISVKLSVI